MKKLKELFATLKYKIRTKTLGKRIMVVMLLVAYVITLGFWYHGISSNKTVAGKMKQELYESEGIEDDNDLEWIMKQIRDFTL